MVYAPQVTVNSIHNAGIADFDEFLVACQGTQNGLHSTMIELLLGKVIEPGAFTADRLFGHTQ